MSAFTKHPFVVSLLAISLSFSGAAYGYAQNATPEANTTTNDSPKIIAKGEGFVVTEDELALSETDQGIDLSSIPADQRQEILVNLIIDMKAAASLAKAEKLDQSEKFQKRLEYTTLKVLADEYMSTELKKKVTPESLKALYDKLAKEVKPEQEVRASHILVKTEEEIKQVQERLKAGEKFEVVAKEKSIDGSKEAGGDLGFFTKERMVPKFADAAFALEVGKISEPVQTEFGWHIILVQEKRERPLPSFDEVKDQLETYQIRITQQEIVKEIREKTKVERLDLPKKDETRVDSTKPVKDDNTSNSTAEKETPEPSKEPSKK